MERAFGEAIRRFYNWSGGDWLGGQKLSMKRIVLDPHLRVVYKDDPIH